MAPPHLRLMPLLLLCAGLVAPRPAAAIVVAGGANNTSAPADDPGWAWTGNFSNKNSGVYLGYGWVLTAYHCVAYGAWTSFTLADGTAHAMDTAAGIQRLKTTNTLGQVVNADLALVKMSATTPPAPGGIAPVHRIADSGLIAGDAVTMIGNGAGPGATEASYWQVNTSTAPWTWTVSNPEDAIVSSYAYDSNNRDLRWGNNTVYSSTPSDVAGLGVNKSLATVFEYSGAIQSYNRAGVANEAQAAVGDSGGAVFHKKGNTAWELAGIMFTTGGYSGQPANQAIEGQATYFADLSHYQSQILQIVPEPATLFLGLLAIGAGLTLRRRLHSTA